MTQQKQGGYHQSRVDHEEAQAAAVAALGRKKLVVVVKVVSERVAAAQVSVALKAFS